MTSSILIDGIFYTDFRQKGGPGWIDYAKNLIAWMQESADSNCNLFRSKPYLDIAWKDQGSGAHKINIEPTQVLNQTT